MSKIKTNYEELIINNQFINDDYDYLYQLYKEEKLKKKMLKKYIDNLIKKINGDKI